MKIGKHYRIDSIKGASAIKRSTRKSENANRKNNKKSKSGDDRKSEVSIKAHGIDIIV